ncbi:orotidine-5'-phosphate decarboxylase [bacterium]|nr:orotidine-5'-phosphate decarboxylase [bacterium]
MAVKKPIFAKERIVLALDFDSLEEAEKYVILLKDYVGYFKIGLQLAVSCGMQTVEMIKNHGGKVFFDAKFNDIPNTVAKASASLLKKGVTFFDVNASGGSKMMLTTAKLCRETAKRLQMPKPTILAVTMLSSFGQKTLSEELSVKGNIEDYGIHLAKIAKECDLDGVVASASESAKIRKELGDEFLIMCPAVRPSWSVVNDQLRAVSPSEAIKAGVDFMIIGRPITSHDNPVAAAKLIINEIEDALAQCRQQVKEEFLK